MPRLICEKRELELKPGESVLDGLLRAGVEVGSSCRVGACQSCLVQVTGGEPPARAQVGLKESLRAQGYVLACQAVPDTDLTISLAGAAALDVAARIVRVERLGADILRVCLLPEAEFVYRPGQFLTLVRQDGLSRAYSLASRPSDGPELELHVRVVAGGRMSVWLASGDAVGAPVRVRGPAGECYYVGDNLRQPLILVGTGSGLAPLWGILREALASGHEAAIELWHGARTAEGLYLQRELRELARLHPQLSYHPCVLGGSDDAPSGLRVGRLDELLLRELSTPSGPRFYLCGDPELVRGLKRSLFLKGAPLRDIYADAFVSAPAA